MTMRISLVLALLLVGLLLLPGVVIAGDLMDKHRGARVVLYYIHLDVNKKHSTPSYYEERTKRLCVQLEQRGVEVSFVGDNEWLEGLGSDCEHVIQTDLNWKLGDLRYDEETKEMDHDHCCTKSNRCTDRTGPNFHEMARLWLNKMYALCHVAEQHPDERTTFMDLATPERVLDIALSVPLIPGTIASRSYPKDKKAKHAYWFGQRGCTDYPIQSASYIALYGRDCEHLLPAYHQEVMIKASSADTARREGHGCMCFDEEMCLSAMITSRPDLWTNGRSAAEIKLKSVAHMTPVVPLHTTGDEAGSLHITPP
jgi:hypothetical protein